MLFKSCTSAYALRIPVLLIALTAGVVRPGRSASPAIARRTYLCEPLRRGNCRLLTVREGTARVVGGSVRCGATRAWYSRRLPSVAG